MFLDVPAPLDYIDPWTESLDTRLNRLASAPRRIAYFYEHPDTSTFRYRVFNPGYTLEANQRCGTSAAWFDHRDLAETDRFVELADALVICRAKYNAQVAKLVSRAKRKQIPVIFDCDDLVFDVNRLHMIVDTLDLNQHDDAMWNEWFAMASRIGTTMRLCEAFTTTNSYLATRATEYIPGLKTSIVPNYLNKEQQALSDCLFAAKEKSRWARDGRVHIGYFSGSPTHAKDFALVASAVAQLMSDDERVVLRVVGFLAIEGELTRFRDRIEFYPLQDFMNLQRLIAEVEINIAPLKENTFTNCKSELKFFEAAICGTLTLASPTFTFTASIEDGRTGYLVPSHGWLDALRRAVDVVDRMNEYQEMAHAARSYVVDNYGWDRHSETIVNAVFG